ncbi:GTPase, partial [Helicobacter pylori]|nr:GTPase [Helicobacter pylori]
GVARALGFAFFFFLLKCVRKMRLRQEAKMKNIYLDVKANIEKLQNIFKNTDNENERLKKFN